MHVVRVDLHDLTVYMSNMADVFQEAGTDYPSQLPGTYPPPDRFFLLTWSVLLSLSLSLSLCHFVCVLCPTLPVPLIVHSWLPVRFSLTFISFQNTDGHKLQFTCSYSTLYGFRFQFEIIIGVFTFINYVHLYNVELYGIFLLLIVASIQHSGSY
jgi:hypothetical protein